jgi:hypothetical protein
VRLEEYDSWHTKKFLSTLSTHESRMFCFVYFLGSLKRRALISNINRAVFFRSEHLGVNNNVPIEVATPEF